MTLTHPLKKTRPRALGFALGALLSFPLLAGCKLVEAGNDGLSTVMPAGYSAVPDELAGSLWGGSDDQCAYAFGFPNRDTLEGLVRCKVPNAKSTVTSRVLRRVGFKREADTDGLATWSLYVPAGFLSNSCSKPPPGAHEAQSFLTRINNKGIGAGSGPRLENAYRKGHWLASSSLKDAEVEAMRQEAASGPGCQPQDQ